MRLPRIRFTIRSWMAAVTVFGVSLGLLREYGEYLFLVAMVLIWTLALVLPVVLIVVALTYGPVALFAVHLERARRRRRRVAGVGCDEFRPRTRADRSRSTC
jgi:hypothetical protein